MLRATACSASGWGKRVRVAALARAWLQAARSSTASTTGPRVARPSRSLMSSSPPAEEGSSGCRWKGQPQPSADRRPDGKARGRSGGLRWRLRNRRPGNAERSGLDHVGAAGDAAEHLQVPLTALGEDDLDRVHVWILRRPRREGERTAGLDVMDPEPGTVDRNVSVEQDGRLPRLSGLEPDRKGGELEAPFLGERRARERARAE